MQGMVNTVRQMHVFVKARTRLGFLVAEKSRMDPWIDH